MLLVRGERVYLRHPRKADVHEFTGLVISSRSFLHPWVTPASTPEAYARYLQNSRRVSVCAFVICRVDDQRIMGVCDLSQIFRGNLQRAFLGYWVGAAFSGRGYMTDALHLALSLCVRETETARNRGRHPAGEHRLQGARGEGWFPIRGFLPAISEGGWSLERS